MRRNRRWAETRGIGTRGGVQAQPNVSLHEHSKRWQVVIVLCDEREVDASFESSVRTVAGRVREVSLVQEERMLRRDPLRHTRNHPPLEVYCRNKDGACAPVTLVTVHAAEVNVSRPRRPRRHELRKCRQPSEHRVLHRDRQANAPTACSASSDGADANLANERRTEEGPRGPGQSMLFAHSH